MGIGRLPDPTYPLGLFPVEKPRQHQKTDFNNKGSGKPRVNSEVANISHPHRINKTTAEF
jgi:hypothetical protein